LCALGLGRIDHLLDSWAGHLTSCTRLNLLRGVTALHSRSHLRQISGRSATKACPCGIVNVFDICATVLLDRGMNNTVTRKSSLRSRRSRGKSGKRVRVSKKRPRRSRSRSRSRSRLPSNPRGAQRAANLEREVERALPITASLGGLDNLLPAPVKSFLKPVTGVFDDIFSIFGAGDYKEIDASLPAALPFETEANSVLQPALVDSVPMFGTHEGFVDISHREFLGDVIALSGTDLVPPIWANNQYLINPSNAACFPWLSTIAPSFELYCLHGGVFEYKTTSGFTTGAATPALSSVCMATVTNVNTRPFTTKRQVLNHFFSSSTVASASMLHPLECAPEFSATQAKFIYNSDRVEGATNDYRLDDFGRMQLMIVGGPVPPVGGSVLGELWFTYKIRLYRPRLNRTGAIFLDGPALVEEPPDPPEIHVPFVPHCALADRVAALEAFEAKDEEEDAALSARVAGMLRLAPALDAPRQPAGAGVLP
jgi:hypothetical protein